jgi:hypothetical protein
MDPNAPPTLQPVAPQSPGGDLLMGKFKSYGSFASQHWKKIAIVAVVVLLAWYLIKKYR